MVANRAAVAGALVLCTALPASAGTCPAAGPGTYDDTVTRGEPGTCLEFSLAEGETVIVSLKHTGGAPLVSGHLRGPSGKILGGMQFYAPQGSGREAKSCITSQGGTYRLEVSAYNIDGSATYSATLDTLTEIASGTLHLPAHDTDPRRAALGAVITASNTGRCGPWL